MKTISLPSPARLAARLVVFYIVLCVLMFAFQRSFLFFPSHDSPSSDLTAWISQGETIGFCREAHQPRTVWLMTHGNGGQAAHRDYVLDCLDANDSLYVLEYPGYGGRQGTPSRTAFDQAAREAYQLLTDQYPDTPIGVIGESLGSGPASALASANRPPDKIVLVVPFDRLHAVASRRFFFLPVKWLLLDNWDNIESLRQYPGPVDIYAARDDTVIPSEHARHLAQQIAHAHFRELPCGHNEWSTVADLQIQR